jgi:hypothetical protein
LVDEPGPDATNALFMDSGGAMEALCVHEESDLMFAACFSTVWAWDLVFPLPVEDTLHFV